MNNKIKRLENQESKTQCTNCRRVIGFTVNDEDRCKYGLTSIYKGKPKCKYFKRHVKYITINGISKIKSFHSRELKTETKYIQGRFVTKIISRL